MTIAIRILLFGLLFAGQVSGAVADDHFQVTTLAPDLLMLSTDQGSYCTNSLVFTGEDGILLVDTHGTSDREAFKKFIDDLGLGAPRYIINTHRHEEHIGGNAIFGPDPVIVAHHLLPEKLRSGAFLFSEYPPDSYPDITVSDSHEISFNGEIIRLVDIGGTHDDNEIMVHFTHHKIAHLSSVVNGFNFPSVDSDGDVLKFESTVRRLMTLLPQDVRLISGHNGRASGFDFVGTWDQLPAYAEMMKSTVAIVDQGLADGRTLEEMQGSGVLDDYKHYAGSYVGTDGWIDYIVDALTVPRETRKDIFKPIFETWKKEGARAAVDRYRQLEKTRKEEFDFHETTLLSIGSKLYDRGLFEDACEFLLGSIDLYPESEYHYYSHYLAARGFHKLDQPDKAVKHCRESISSNPDFAGASKFLEELSGTFGESAGTGTNASELEIIEQTVRDSIGWALTKDRPLLESIIAHDEDYFSFHPHGLTPVHGYEEFLRGFDTWMDERFKATHFDVRNFRAHLSRSGDVAWFSAILDDCFEWEGRPGCWSDTRWTGVLEKSDGRWVIMQMHFSFAADRVADNGNET